MNEKINVRRILKIIQNQKALVALLVIFIMMPFLTPYFFTRYNMVELLLQCAILLIMAGGVTFVVISGECDLSIGGLMCLSGIVAIKLQESMPLFPAFVLAIVVGLLVGAVNAFLVVSQNADGFITTLGMGMLLKGVSLVLTNAHPIQGTNVIFHKIGTISVLGIPLIVIITIILLAIAQSVMKRTAFGRDCYAVGGNFEVAVYAGIRAKRHKVMTYLLSGAVTALAGFLLSARLNSGAATYGDNTALLINCGIVVGGTSFGGGIGGIPQTILGMFLFATLENAMNLMNVNSYVQQLIRGIIIVGVVCLDCYTKKKKRDDV